MGYHRYCWALVLLLALANFATSERSDVLSDEFQEFRLPTSLVPTHYALQLQPILDDTPGFTRFTAPGTVTITVNCTEDTETIKIHSLDLTITEAVTQVTNVETAQKVPIVDVGYEPENEFFVINLGEALKAGSRYDIFIEFITPVSQSLITGMYLDQYVDPATNETKYVATTLFAATSARRCFPSFDEPHLKAVFSVSLGRKESYHALSNMYKTSTEPIPGMDGWFLDQFAPSLPMSTYLVAMIVSDMTYEEAEKDEEDAPTIRVYAPYYFIERGGGVYGANQTKTVLQKYENYFDSSYMLNKLDSASLPRFKYSAMENWGLITYNDQVLLYFPGETTEEARYTITYIVAHEVVHNYFGNMITCEWWTWIWLNEGFATYFGHLGVDMTYPEFNPWERFIINVYQVAMAADDLPNAHPVANEPKSLADIDGIYDDIAYRKGATLLRMMQSFLSEEVMVAGVRNYIKAKQLTTARQDDFFQTIQGAADALGKILPASVKEIMDTWTLVSGYPLIRVSRINPGEVQFTQERFEASSDKTKADETWWVPITVAVISPTPKEHFLWMPRDKTGITFSIPDNEVFVLNPRSDEYYRVLYSSELLEELVSNHGSCSSSSDELRKPASSASAKFLDDYIAFLKAGLVSKDTLQKVLTSNIICLESGNLVVWQTLFNYYTSELLSAEKINDIHLAAQIKSSMKYLPEIITRALTRIEGKSNSGETSLLQAELLFWTCLIDPAQHSCNDYVKEKMNTWIPQTDSPFPVDLEETYFCMAASMNEQYWEKIHIAAQRKISRNAQARLLSALTCSSNKDLLEKILANNDWFKDFRSRKSTLQYSNSLEDAIMRRITLRLLFNEPARNIFSTIFL